MASSSRPRRSLRALGCLAAVLAATVPMDGVFAADPASAATACGLVASPTGSDSASGAPATPFRTAQRLIDALGAGQTGCLRAGTYTQSMRFNHGGAAAAPLTLASYPGERATVVGRLYIPSGSNYINVSGLSLDGRNAENLPSPTVNSSDISFTGNDVTNQNTGICFDLGNASWGSATRVLIERNRIHGCGQRPSTNYQHGIYNEDSSYVTIAWNLIYDNADRGIQLYPNARNASIVHNVIDGNGEGILFSGDFGVASSNNDVSLNVVSNASMRSNVESWYPAGNPQGQNNVVHNNCLWGGAGGGVDTSGGGFTAQANTVADPQFANRAAGDFRMASTSPCAGIAGDIQAAVDGTQAPAPASPPPATSVAARVLLVPSVVSVSSGTRISGSVASLGAADRKYYGVQSSADPTRMAAFTASFMTVPATPSALGLAYRGNATTVCTQAIALYRFSTGVWTDLDARPATLVDQTVSGLVPPGSPSEYVSSAGEVRSRVTCSSPLTGLTLYGNQVQLSYDQA